MEMPPSFVVIFCIKPGREIIGEVKRIVTLIQNLIVNGITPY
jgi:hypothetical protein